MSTSIKLYHYWRSSCSWRVRWALDYKGIEATLQPVSLLNGESEEPTHLARHPLGYVPVLEWQSLFLTDSSAIVRWLEERFPETPSLFPGTSDDRGRINALASIISSDTQPLQNLNVLQRHSADP
ncbi:MAG: glutathione S-transferase N-terminal domain-containing protein, partial [Bdellovibrionales bacterium]|nr:glutathione S-transferase N-terminal domain-containing protein [Bdellovibrionales bacterium]